MVRPQLFWPCSKLSWCHHKSCTIWPSAHCAALCKHDKTYVFQPIIYALKLNIEWTNFFACISVVSVLEYLYKHNNKWGSWIMYIDNGLQKCLSNIIMICFHHFHQLRHIRHSYSATPAATIVHTFILSLVDQWHGIFARASKKHHQAATSAECGNDCRQCYPEIWQRSDATDTCWTSVPRIIT